MVITMKNTIKYIVSISALGGLFSIIYMFFIGIEVYVNRSNYYILRIILFAICSLYLANVFSAIMQFLYGKLNGYNCCVLNFYPIYVVKGRLKFSMNLITLADIRTMYDVHQLDENNQQGFLDIKEKTKKFQIKMFFILGIMWFLIAMYFKIYMFIFMSCTCFGWVITCMYFKEIDFIQETEFPLKEMLYSKEVNQSLVLDYLGQYVKNIVMYEYEPQYLYSIILFIMICYRHQLEEQSLEQLDEKVYTLFQKHNKLNVVCRAIIFDYYDMRFCLSEDDDVKVYSYRILSEFVKYDWDIKMPSLVMKRYDLIKASYGSQQEIKVDKKYQRYFW